jgi:hypothetical protein
MDQSHSSKDDRTVVVCANSNTLTSGLLCIPVLSSSVHKVLHDFCPVYLLYSDSVSVAQIEAMPLYLSMGI